MAVTPPPTGPPPAAGVHAGALLGGRYRLDEKIASGGMAQVWLGTDEVLRRAIAVKVLHHHLAADQTFVTRFRHEAISVARLSHPAIVNVYDTCSDDDGVEAIVMELVRGHTLRDRIDQGQIDPWQAANIAAHVAGALAVAHAAGLVHRDIKPANILLSDDGRVKVGDFGIAKAAESADLTQEGSFVGTAKYLAPEQVEGKPVDGRTDLYSLGIVLYEMLCGRVPFEGDSASATALARLHTDPPRPRLIRPGIPRELDALTMRLLSRTPDGRYSTASETRNALLGAGADDRVHGPDTVADHRAGGPTTAPTRAVPAPPPVGSQTPAPAQPQPPGPVPSPDRHPGYGHPSPPTPPGAVRFTESERRWLMPTLVIVLIAVALGVAGLLIGRSGSNIFDDDPDDATDEPTPVTVPAEPLTIVRSIDFDPEGNGTEHRSEAEAGYAFDGDLATGWSTETYKQPDWGRLKSGVGLIFELDESSEIGSIEIDSPMQGWAAEIYVADQVNDVNLDQWGSPTAHIGSEQTDGSSTASADLDGIEGRAVLVWLTKQGTGSTVTLSEVRLLP